MNRVQNKDSKSVVEDPMERMVLTLTGMSTLERKRCKARSIKFPTKLMYVLECGEYDDCIIWDPTGLSFIIINPKAFERKVLPEIFKEAKFASFQRKLMRWRFVKKGKVCSSVYTHPEFQRGNWTQCALMTSEKKRGIHGAGVHNHHHNDASSIFQQRLHSLHQQASSDAAASLMNVSPLAKTAMTSRFTNNSLPSSISALSSMIPKNVSLPSLTDISEGSVSSVYNMSNTTPGISSHPILALRDLDSFGVGEYPSTSNCMVRSISPFLSLGNSSLGGQGYGSLLSTSGGIEKFHPILGVIDNAGHSNISTLPSALIHHVAAHSSPMSLTAALVSEGDILKNAYDTLHRSL